MFKCEDMSESNFCKINGNYDAFLSKYKRDPYRAKGILILYNNIFYIHYLLSN